MEYKDEKRGKNLPPRTFALVEYDGEKLFDDDGVMHMIAAFHGYEETDCYKAMLVSPKLMNMIREYFFGDFSENQEFERFKDEEWKSVSSSTDNLEGLLIASKDSPRAMSLIETGNLFNILYPRIITTSRSCVTFSLLE